MVSPRALLPLLGTIFSVACGEQQPPVGTAYEACLRWRRAGCERNIRCLGDRAYSVEECLARNDSEYECTQYRSELSSGECIARRLSSCADAVAVEECGACDPAKTVPICMDVCLIPTSCSE